MAPFGQVPKGDHATRANGNELSQKSKSPHFTAEPLRTRKLRSAVQVFFFTFGFAFLSIYRIIQIPLNPFPLNSESLITDEPNSLPFTGAICPLAKRSAGKLFGSSCWKCFQPI